MLDRTAARIASSGQNRAVFVHSAGSRRFLGPSGEEGGREVTVEEVEALAAAGFDIVEITTGSGQPLCAALAALRPQSPQPLRLWWPTQVAPARDLA